MKAKKPLTFHSVKVGDFIFYHSKQQGTLPGKVLDYTRHFLKVEFAPDDIRKVGILNCEYQQ